MRLGDFATSCEGDPTLVGAPFALHAAAVVDLAPGHSLIAALRDAGLRTVFVAEWRSADADIRFLGIDDYLATLNVPVDQLGGTVDLIGLRQGGWIALLYAARFPAKICELVLPGAPIDIAAEPSALSALADASPLDMTERSKRWVNLKRIAGLFALCQCGSVSATYVLPSRINLTGSSS